MVNGYAIDNLVWYFNIRYVIKKGDSYGNIECIKTRRSHRKL